MGLQKVDGGGWRDLQVASKGGAYNRLYADADKNGAQIRREGLTKKLVRVLKGMHSGVDFFAKKSDGTVTSSYVSVAKIVVVDVENYSIQWNGLCADKIGIDRADAVARLRAEDVRSEPEWV